MDSGTYASASAGLSQFRRLEIVNNNLANVNTPGFKRQVLVQDPQPFEETLANQIAADDPYARKDHERYEGTVNFQAITDFSVGAVKETGSKLDAALRNPNDFFVISTPQGQQYTRAGNFTLNSTGTLVTPDGFSVLSDGGELSVNGPGAAIQANGDVTVNGDTIGRLQVVKISDPSKLERVSGSRFRIAQGSGVEAAGTTADLIPEALEMSNVSAITSMVELISTNRAFEMYAKTARSIDDLNQTAISQYGRGR